MNTRIHTEQCHHIMTGGFRCQETFSTINGQYCKTHRSERLAAANHRRVGESREYKRRGTKAEALLQPFDAKCLGYGAFHQERHIVMLRKQPTRRLYIYCPACAATLAKRDAEPYQLGNQRRSNYARP